MGRQVDRRPVFLSASIPAEDRNPKYFTTADVVAIRDAVRALASTVLPTGLLVFGGHPAISPLVLMVARRLKAVGRVRIYQSAFFRSVVPRESVAFPNIVWTKSLHSAREDSLLLMRKEMLQSERFVAGVFIGGMEGVEQEFELFRQTHPGSPAYPIASTGAAAAMIFGRGEGPVGSIDRAELSTETAYRDLFRRILERKPTRQRGTGRRKNH
jgi:hypothetical protein